MHIIQILHPFPVSVLVFLPRKKKNIWAEVKHSLLQLKIVALRLNHRPWQLQINQQTYLWLNTKQMAWIRAFHTYCICILYTVQHSTDVLPDEKFPEKQSQPLTCVSSTDIKRPQRPWAQQARRPQQLSATWAQPSAESWRIWGIIALAIFSRLLHLLRSLALSFPMSRSSTLGYDFTSDS